MKREDDFQERRKHLANLSEEELKDRFWSLASQIMDPLIDLAKKNTTPSIERSVILRMGFSSMEAGALVKGVMEHGLMGKGAGHVVYKISKLKNIPIREAGLALIDGKYWEDAENAFRG